VTVLALPLLVVCGGAEQQLEERPPPAGERVAVEFARRITSEDADLTVELLSEEVFPDPSASVREFHEKLARLHPRIAGSPRWVGESVLAPFSLHIPFEGVDEGGHPTKGVFDVRVRQEAAEWRVVSFGFVITEGTL